MVPPLGAPARCHRLAPPRAPLPWCPAAATEAAAAAAAPATPASIATKAEIPVAVGGHFCFDVIGVDLS